MLDETKAHILDLTAQIVNAYLINHTVDDLPAFVAAVKAALTSA